MKVAHGCGTNCNEAGTNCVQKRRKSCRSSMNLRSLYYRNGVWPFKYCGSLPPARAREESTQGQKVEKVAIGAPEFSLYALRRRLFWQDEKGENVRSLFSSLTSHSPSNLQDFAEKSLTRSGFSRNLCPSTHMGGQVLMSEG